MKIKTIKKLTKPQLLHAIANACYDVINGVDNAQTTIERIHKTLQNGLFIRQYSYQKGDYHLLRGC